MRITSITTKHGAAIVDPATGRATNRVVAGRQVELGLASSLQPGLDGVYVRKPGSTDAQIVPMPSVVKLDAVVDEAGMVHFDGPSVEGPPEAFGLPPAEPGPDMVVTGADRETGTVTVAGAPPQQRRKKRRGAR